MHRKSRHMYIHTYITRWSVGNTCGLWTHAQWTFCAVFSQSPVKVISMWVNSPTERIKLFHMSTKSGTNFFSPRANFPIIRCCFELQTPLFREIFHSIPLLSYRGWGLGHYMKQVPVLKTPTGLYHHNSRKTTWTFHFCISYYNFVIELWRWCDG